MIGGALLCLWANEGRFDYHAAATRARVLTGAIGSGPGEAIALTGSLDRVSFSGDYVKVFENYMVVDRSAEIYSWVRKRRDDHVTWHKEWRSSVQSNSRNSGNSQTLRKARLTPESYHLGDLDISPQDLHFADERDHLDPNRLSLSEEGRASGLRAEGGFFYLRKHSGPGDQLGDERLSYRAVRASSRATYFGSIREQVGEGKVFEKKSGWVSKLIKDDGVLHHLVNGDRQTALSTMKGHLQRTRWMVRLAGTVASMFGVAMTLEALLHLLIGVPFLGRLVQMGGLLVSVVVGGGLAVGTIAASWLFHHPILALLLVVVLVAVGNWIGRRRKTSQRNATKVLERLQSTPVSAGTGPDAGGIGRAEHVFQHMVKLAVADGKFDATENTFLADWARARSIPDQRIVALFNQAKREEGLPPMEATREDLFYLISLALADDHLSKNEFRRINRLARELKIDGQELGQIIARIRQGREVTR